MLTVMQETLASTSAVAAQPETLPSDFEISRRVLQIRSKWSLSERVRRRREAEQRFNDLVDTLMGPAA